MIITNAGVVTKPKQLIPNSQKDEEWYRQNAVYWSNTIEYIDFEKLKSDIDAACGKIKESDYNYVTDPYNDGTNKKRNAPEKIRNYDIISPIILQLIGEFLKRPTEFIVYNKNSNIENEKLKLENKLLVEKLQQEFVNHLIRLGLFVPNQTDEQGQPIQPPLSEEYINGEVKNLVDEKSKQGQYKLDYITSTKDIYDTLKEAFVFYISTACTFTYKDIINGDIQYSQIDGRGFGYIASKGTRYIEDAIATKYTRYYPMAEVLDMFQDEKEYDKLEAYLNSEVGKDIDFSGYGSFESHFKSNYNRLNGGVAPVRGNEDEADTVKIDHLQWKTQCCIYRVYSVNPETGETTHTDYDDEYEPLETDVYDKRICTEKHEVFVVNDKFVFKGQPLEHLRADYDNPNVCKGSYNGINMQPYLDSALSIPAKLDPFQKAYNIIKFQINKMIIKNKDKIAVLPLSLVTGFKNSKEGIDYKIGSDYISSREIANKGIDSVDEIRVRKGSSPLADSLYYADATQFLMVNDSKLSYEQAQIAATLLKDIDLGLGNYIQYLYQYAEMIKEEAYELVGFNRFRRGGVEQRDAVSNVQQATYSSSLITEEYFETFRRFVEKEGLGLLDLSKFLYRDGLKASFLNTSYELVSIDIPPGSLSYTNLGIVVKSGGKTKEDFEALKANLQAFSQNQMKPSTVAKIINGSSNFASLIDELEKAEKEFQEQAAQQAQAEQANNDAKNQLENQKLQLEKYKIDVDKKLKEIELGIKLNEDNDLDYIKEQNASRKSEFEDNIKVANVKLAQGKLAMDKYKADMALKVAKENKSQ